MFFECFELNYEANFALPSDEDGELGGVEPPFEFEIVTRIRSKIFIVFEIPDQAKGSF